MWPPLPPLPGAGPRRGPAGLPSAGAERRQVGQPGRVGCGQRSVPAGTQGSRYRGLGQERVPVPRVGPKRGDRGSARKRVPRAEQVLVPVAQR